MMASDSNYAISLYSVHQQLDLQAISTALALLSGASQVRRQEHHPHTSPVVMKPPVALFLNQCFQELPQRLDLQQ
jgi:hypothetical protein